MSVGGYRPGSGRKPINLRRYNYRKRFGLTLRQQKALLTMKMLDQLDNCADDESRKVLLGVKEEYAENA